MLGLAAQLPFAATSSSNQYSVPPPAAVSPSVSPPVSPPIEAQLRANEEALRHLFATTKSVMKRHGDATAADNVSARNASANPAAILDDQIVQASHMQTQGGAAGRQSNADKTGSGSPPATTGETDPNGAAAAINAETRALANASADLLAGALATPPIDSLDGRPVALDGRPVPLAEALGRSSTSVRRLEVAALYWKLSLASADYHWSLVEFVQLRALPGNEDAVDAPLLTAAQAAAHARMLEAKAAAVTLQQELADAIGQPTQQLPLTVEQPLVGPYRTEFDTIFAGRAAPGRSRAIHRALPHWREAIDIRTAAVQAASSAVPAAEQAFVKQKTDITRALLAHQELISQRRAFLNAVRAYNAEIVEYASYVAGPTTSTATLVSMLTRSKPNKPSASAGSASSFETTNEPTLASPMHDPAVRQAGSEQQNGGEDWRGVIPSFGDPGTPATSSDGATEPATRLQEVDPGQQN
jgi:hypothetical protein